MELQLVEHSTENAGVTGLIQWHQPSYGLPRLPRQLRRTTDVHGCHTELGLRVLQLHAKDASRSSSTPSPASSSRRQSDRPGAIGTPGGRRPSHGRRSRPSEERSATIRSGRGYRTRHRRATSRRTASIARSASASCGGKLNSPHRRPELRSLAVRMSCAPSGTPGGRSPRAAAPASRASAIVAYDDVTTSLSRQRDRHRASATVATSRMATHGARWRSCSRQRPAAAHSA